MLKIGLVGYGYWGVNLLRNFMGNKNCTMAYVCDARPDRLAAATKLYPSVQTTTSFDDLLNDATLDAIVIATPVFLHFDLAKKALLHGKHVLVEKPLTSNVAEAEELVNLAAQKNLVLAVDHTFLFTSSVQKIKEYVDTDYLGKIQYFDSTRINLGLFQPDVNVIWDLAPHDISILNYLIHDKPESVICTGKAHLNNKLENIAYLTLNYQSDFIAHFNCSWISPVKVRRILIGGDKKMCLFDDVEPTEKIKIYDSGFELRQEDEIHKYLIDYRMGDIFLPKLAQKEALAALVNDFAEAITTSKKPLTDGVSGLEVVKILEAAQQSINQGGKEIKLKW